MFYCHTARHTTPHTFGGDTGHTHTHADEVAGEICLQPMLNCPTSRAARSSGQPLWPRRQSQERQSQDLFFCSSACFYVGVLCGGNPCEHEENLQTPHRKAREIAHLSTEGLGRTCPQYQQCPMRESVPFCCEAAVQAPEPPCHIDATE